MNRYWRIFVTLLLGLAVSHAPLPRAYAQPLRFAPAPKAQATSAQSTVKVEVLPDTTAVVVGQNFRVGVLLEMEPGWHVYYKDPGQLGKPTSVSWRLPERFQSGELNWPPPTQFQADGFTSYGYEGSVFLWTTVTVPNTVKPGDQVAIRADLQFLACKDVCMPGSATAESTLPVVASASQATAANSDRFSVSKGVLERVHSQSEKSFAAFLWALISAFIGGMLLNLMPCVLPVLGLKVRSIIIGGSTTRGEAIRRGLAYTTGTLATFQALALVVIIAKLAGHAIGWGFQFQQPLFLIGLAVLMTVFSLSLFGLFFVQVSAGSEQLDKLAQAGGSRGAFFEGILATLLSTPCTAPFLGTALGFAFSQPWWAIVLIFLLVSLGLSAPYLLLSAYPQLLSRLPKPGAWMERFKELMGFAMLGSVVWVLSVLGTLSGAGMVVRTLVVLLVSSLGAWLIAHFANGSRKRKVITWTAALILALGSAYLTLAPAIAHPQHQQPASTQESFTPRELERHLAAGQVVLVDFTADWCLTCKVNERAVLGSQSVKDSLKQTNAVVLRADWTDGDDQITELIHKFGRSGVPLYVIFSPNRPDQPLVLPEVLTPQMVVDGLHAAAQP